MTAAEVFTVLAIVSISSDPLQGLLYAIMDWSYGTACLGRIQTFLTVGELQDPRNGPTEHVPQDEEAKKEKRTTEPSRARFAVLFEGVAVLSTTGSPVLKNVDLKISWGDLVIFCGPINCGKSTLLHCIIGESKLDDGAVTVGTKLIAFSSQEVWIQNLTLMACVVGILDFDAGFYHEVIFACALDVDIATLRDGDQTVVGSGGCNLSGGQKQRLVRIIMFDECFTILTRFLSEPGARCVCSRGYHGP